MKILPSSQKLRGGYYTPSPIADFLANWAIRSGSQRVLEPSCGDGAILRAALRRLQDLGASGKSATARAVGVEVDRTEAKKAQGELRNSGLPGEIIHGDFFAYVQNQNVLSPLLPAASDGQTSFDAVLGNPPFIRYQNFPEEYRQRAFALMESYGLRPNRLTNSWVPFLVAASSLLSAEGRLAMVLPAELMQVGYAAEVRQFLSTFFHRITLVTFRSLVFESIQQEVVLLLGEKAHEGAAGIRVVECDSASELHAVAVTTTARPKRLNHTTDKWTQYFLSQVQIDLLRRLLANSALPRLSGVAEVDVGVVTGDNEFFALSESQAQLFGIADYTIPLVSRSAQLTGLNFSKRDWREHLADGHRMLLFTPEDQKEAELPSAVRKYINHGVEAGSSAGYKCRIRRNWYVVPSKWVPDAFFTRQVHAFPRLVLNGAGATATDTLHRVRFAKGVDRKEVAVGMLNSLTFAFAETMGRSYGGGVLTFEPSEVEALPVPLQGASALDFVEIDALLRSGRIEACIELTDRALLIDGLGLDARDVRRLRSAYEVLRDRRINRRRKVVPA